MRSRSTCDVILSLQAGTDTLFQSQMRSRSTCDAKPIIKPAAIVGFQSQMRSRSTCDAENSELIGVAHALFQSQMRSRSTCDLGIDSMKRPNQSGFNLR